MTLPYLRFRMGPQRYALPLSRVRELIEYHQPALLPGAPRVLRGLINVRGEPLPLVDLAWRLGMTLVTEVRKRPVLLLEAMWQRGPVCFGADCDDVDGLIELDETQLSPPSPFAKLPPPEFVKGVLAEDDEITLVLDVERILSEDDLLATELTGEPMPES